MGLKLKLIVELPVIPNKKTTEITKTRKKGGKDIEISALSLVFY